MLLYSKDMHKLFDNNKLFLSVIVQQLHGTILSFRLNKTLPIDTLPINNSIYLSLRRPWGPVRILQRSTGPFSGLPGPYAVSLALQRSTWPLSGLPGPSVVYLAPQWSSWSLCGLPGPSAVYLAPQRSPWPFSGLPGPSVESLALQRSTCPSVCFLSQCVAGHVCTCAGQPSIRPHYFHM